MSFGEIYQAHKKTVYNLALQYVQNTEDAEEITQDVFVTIHGSLDKFREGSNIATWIYRITVNKSLDYLRLRNRKKRFGYILRLLGEEPLQIPEFNHPGVLLEHKEATQKIFRLINELPENQRTALILQKIEALSQQEIASIMEISAKAVESLVQRAKVALQKKIEASEGFEKLKRLK